MYICTYIYSNVPALSSPLAQLSLRSPLLPRDGAADACTHAPPSCQCLARLRRRPRLELLGGMALSAVPIYIDIYMYTYICIYISMHIYTVLLVRP